MLCSSAEEFFSASRWQYWLRSPKWVSTLLPQKLCGYLEKKKRYPGSRFYFWLMPQPNGSSSHAVGNEALEFTAASFRAQCSCESVGHEDSTWASRGEGKGRYRYILDGEREVEDCDSALWRNATFLACISSFQTILKRLGWKWVLSKKPPLPRRRTRPPHRSQITHYLIDSKIASSLLECSLSGNEMAN